MGVTLERAWAIAALLEEADAERAGQEMERAWFLTQPVTPGPLLVAPAAKKTKPAKAKRALKPRARKKAAPRKVRPAKKLPVKTKTPRRTNVPNVKAKAEPAIWPDAAERLRQRRRARLGLD